MSLETHHDALLEGFEPPQFPISLKALHTLGKLAEGTLWQKAAEEMSDYSGHTVNDKTSDDYVWFRGLHFKVPEGTICLLIPFANDPEKADGSQNDRSTAVYVSSPEIKLEQIREIITQLAIEYVKYWLKTLNNLEDESIRA